MIKLLNDQEIKSRVLMSWNRFSNYTVEIEWQRTYVSILKPVKSFKQQNANHMMSWKAWNQISKPQKNKTKKRALSFLLNLQDDKHVRSSLVAWSLHPGDESRCWVRPYNPQPFFGSLAEQSSARLVISVGRIVISDLGNPSLPHLLSALSLTKLRAFGSPGKISLEIDGSPPDAAYMVYLQHWPIKWLKCT